MSLDDLRRSRWRRPRRFFFFALPNVDVDENGVRAAVGRALGVTAAVETCPRSAARAMPAFAAASWIVASDVAISLIAVGFVRYVNDRRCRSG